MPHADTFTLDAGADPALYSIYDPRSTQIQDSLSENLNTLCGGGTVTTTVAAQQATIRRMTDLVNDASIKWGSSRHPTAADANARSSGWHSGSSRQDKGGLRGKSRCYSSGQIAMLRSTAVESVQTLVDVLNAMTVSHKMTGRTETNRRTREAIEGKARQATADLARLDLAIAASVPGLE